MVTQHRLSSSAPSGMRSRLLCAALLGACLIVQSGCASRASERMAASQAVTAKSIEIALAAMNFMDVPYTWGGNSAAEGFDCSGFTRHVYQSIAGIVLPRHSAEQARAAGFKEVPRQALAPGDLVFFNTLSQAYSHVGIYVGEGKFVHAPRTGAVVRIENLEVSSYWRSRFTGARRSERLEAPLAQRSIE